jgi:hypothetical protein
MMMMMMTKMGQARSSEVEVRHTERICMATSSFAGVSQIIMAAKNSTAIFITHESYLLQKMDVGKSDLDGVCRGFAWLSEWDFSS